MTTVRRELLDMPPGDALFHKHEFKSLDAVSVSCKMTSYTKGKRKMSLGELEEKLKMSLGELEERLNDIPAIAEKILTFSGDDLDQYETRVTAENALFLLETVLQSALRECIYLQGILDN